MRIVGDSAFKFCIGMQTLDIAKGLELIESEALSNCNRLTSIVIPTTVSSIGANAFYDCTSLSSITVRSYCSVDDSAFGFSSPASTVSRDFYAYPVTDASIIADSDESSIFHSLGGKGSVDSGYKLLSNVIIADGIKSR